MMCHGRIGGLACSTQLAMPRTLAQQQGWQHTCGSSAAGRQQHSVCLSVISHWCSSHLGVYWVLISNGRGSSADVVGTLGDVLHGFGSAAHILDGLTRHAVQQSARLNKFLSRAMLR